jgi:hypothetical protein
VGSRQSEAALIVTAANDAPFWYGNIRIKGTGTSESGTWSREAGYGTLLSESPDIRNTPVLGRTTRNLTLAVVSAELDPAMVRLEGGPVFETSRGGNIKIPVHYTRAGNIKSDLRLQVVGLPGEVKSSELVFKPDGTEAALELNLNNSNVPLGTYSFYLFGQTTVGHQRNADEVARAEQTQKAFETLLAEISESEKKAASELEAAKQEAARQSSEPASEIPSAADGTQVAAEPQVAVAQAEERLKQLVEKKARAEQHRKTLEERVNQAKKQNEPKDLIASIASTPVTLRIAKLPIALLSPQTEATVKRATNGAVALELPVRLQRLFGFQESVELRAVPPENVAGLELATASVPKDQSEAILRLAIKPEAKPGRYAFRLLSKLRFGEVDLEDAIPINIEIVE